MSILDRIKQGFSNVASYVSDIPRRVINYTTGTTKEQKFEDVKNIARKAREYTKRAGEFYVGADDEYKQLEQRVSSMTATPQEQEAYRRKKLEIQVQNLNIAGSLTTKIAGKTKAIVSKIANSNVAEDIFKQLKKFKLSDDIAEKMSKTLTNVTDEQAIYRMAKSGQAISQIEKKTGSALSSKLRGALSQEIENISKRTLDKETEDLAIKKIVEETIGLRKKQLVDEARKVADNIPEFKGFVTKKLEPLAEKAKTVTREEFKEKINRGLSNPDINISGSVKEFLGEIENAGFKSIDDFYDEVISKEVKTGIEGKKILEGVPGRTGLKKIGLGVEDKILKTTESKALKSKLKIQEIAAKRGAEFGYKKAKDEFIAQVKNKEITKNNLYEALHQYAKNKLPKEIRDSILSQKRVKELKTTSQLNKILDNVNSAATKYEKNKAFKQEVGKLKQELHKVGIQKGFSVVKPSGKRELTNKFKEMVRERYGISYKDANPEQLTKILADAKNIAKGDRFLTKNEIEALNPLIEDSSEIFKGIDFKNATLKTLKDKFGVNKEFIKNKFFSKILSSTEIKKQAPELIKRVIGNSQVNAQLKRIDVKKIAKKFDSLQKEAFKSRKTWGIFKNKKKTWEMVFDYLDGKDVKLTDKEKVFANWMKDYFETAKNYLVKNGDMEKGRESYVPHVMKTFGELVSDHGLIGAIKKAKELRALKKSGDIPVEIWQAMDFVSPKTKFFSNVLQRTGKIDPSKNIERVFKQYMQLFESKKYLDKQYKLIDFVSKNLFENNKGESVKWMQSFKNQIGGRPLDYKVSKDFSGPIYLYNKLVDLNFGLKLFGSPLSAFFNFVGGNLNSAAYLPIHKFLNGKRRFLLRPDKAYKILSKYSFLDGDYLDVASSMTGKLGKKIMDSGYIFQRMAETEVRGSEILGMLTSKEWKSGVISPKRLEEIIDIVDETQGVFTPERASLFSKTNAGRGVLSLSRWMITDANLVKNIIKGSFTGKNKFKNQKRLVKLLTAFAVGGYLADEYSKSGNKNAEKFAKTMQEPIRTLIDPTYYTGMIANNPNMELIRQAHYTLQVAAYKMGINPNLPAKMEIKKGIEDTYTGIGSALEQSGFSESDTSYGTYQQLKDLNPQDQKVQLNEIRKSNPSQYTKIKQYINWDKLEVSKKERNFAQLGVANGERSKAIYKYLRGQKDPLGARRKLIKAGIISDKVNVQINKLIKEEK